MAGADCAPNSVEYWDDFYDDRRSAYDTLYGYEDLRTLLLSLMPLDSRRGQSKVLHAGCGTSNVTDGLWRDGFRSILNIDFSDVVVKLMADRWSDRAALSTEGDAMLTGVQWQQMDLTDLSQLASAHFDMVLEKFTFDAILCQAKDDMLDPRGAAALRELHRVLKLDGVLVSVAWGAERRKALLRSGGLFDVEVHLLPGQASQRPYVYFCRKRLPLPGSSVASQSCEIRGCKGNTRHGIPRSDRLHRILWMTSTPSSGLYVALAHYCGCLCQGSKTDCSASSALISIFDEAEAEYSRMQSSERSKCLRSTDSNYAQARHQRAQEAKEPQVQIRTDGSLEVVIQLDGHAATDLTLDLSESELRWSLEGLTRSLPLPFAIDASSATARRFKNK
ncbi:EEF1AKNMT, partial [Symbiodinium necroappetens]